MAEVFEQYGPCKWKVAGKPEIAFPHAQIEEGYANRLVEHKRLHRDGAKVDDTGSDPRKWTITTEWSNGDEEPGLRRDEQYPDELNRMLDACTVHETGTLTLSTRGPVRARLESYRRVETSEKRDFAAVSFVFVEDNEDDARASSFQAPSARSAAKTAADKILVGAQKEAAWSPGIAELNELAAGLEALAAAPGKYAGDIEATADTIVTRLGDVERAFRRERTANRERAVGALTDPESSHVARQMNRLSDMVRRTSAEKSGVGGRTTTKAYQREMSIFQVATDVEQPAERLIEMNPKLPDLFAIPEGTPVRVLDLQARAA